jgi:CPA2 family monovalent cation:H+ antiporter-2
MYYASAQTDLSPLILGELGSVLLVLGVATYLAVKIKFSVVPIFLVGGIFFGVGGILPLSLSESFLDIGAHIGGILLLLLLGLEFTADEIFGSIKARKSLWLYDLLINFTPGFILGFLFGWGILGATALGGVTYVSSSGIASHSIKDYSLETSEATRRVIAVLVVEDVVLALYLPILTSLVVAASFWAGLLSFAIALSIIGLTLLLASKNLHLSKNSVILGDSATLLLLVFGGALLVAGLSSLLGFSGAVAAFLFGLLLTGDFALVARERLAPLRDLFAALFFLFFGLSINPAALPGAILPALLISLVGIVAKVLTAYIAVKNLPKGSFATALMIFLPRGEFSILIAGLVSLTAFGEEFGAITILFVLFTSLTSSFIGRFCIQSPKP